MASVYWAPEKTSHGPQSWPWWKLCSLRIVRAGPGDPYWYFWIKGIYYNVWFYSRWVTCCWTLTERRGVYRREEMNERGWFDND